MYASYLQFCAHDPRLPAHGQPAAVNATESHTFVQNEDPPLTALLCYSSPWQQACLLNLLTGCGQALPQQWHVRLVQAAHIAGSVRAPEASCPACNLLDLAGRQRPELLAIILVHGSKHHPVQQRVRNKERCQSADEASKALGGCRHVAVMEANTTLYSNVSDRKRDASQQVKPARPWAAARMHCGCDVRPGCDTNANVDVQHAHKDT